MSEDLIDIDNKAAPRLRVHQLNETSSRYDRMAAAPDDEVLVKYWWTWAALTLTVGGFTLLLFLSILSNRKVRKKPFNLFLLYLLVPDIVFSILCCLVCFMNATNGSYYGLGMCNLQYMAAIFGMGANPWVNALIARQVHLMLKNSQQRKRYQLPTTRQVTLQCLAAYGWVLLLGSLGIFGVPGFPTGQISGLACVPSEVDLLSSLLFWLLFFPLWVIIPAGYTIWVAVDIHKRKLLPPTGKRRDLSIYFGRLLFVFIVMWIPALLSGFVLSSWFPTTSFFIGGTWSHLQPFVSSLFTLMKRDIRDVFVNFMTCSCGVQPEPEMVPKRINTFSAESLDHQEGRKRTNQSISSVHIFRSTDLSLPTED